MLSLTHEKLNITDGSTETYLTANGSVIRGTLDVPTALTTLHSLNVVGDIILDDFTTFRGFGDGSGWEITGGYFKKIKKIENTAKINF